MAMQTYTKVAGNIAAPPFCETCDEPMRIKDATVSSRAIHITYRCNTCDGRQVSDGSVDLQG